MKSIVLAFTLKDQPVDRIIKKIQDIALAESSNGAVILIHGFLPRKIILEKGIKTDVIDTLDIYFPIQLNMNINGLPLREKMAEVAYKLEAIVHVIGEVKEGVADEVHIYKSIGVPVVYHKILD